jgi:hypothetical protein
MRFCIMMKLSRVLTIAAPVLAGVSALTLAIAAMSPAEAVSSRVRNACREDYMRFCPSYEPDTPKARQCMRQVGKRLSPGCIDALADAGEIRKRR